MSYERECECMNTDEDRNMNKVLSTVYHVLSCEPWTLEATNERTNRHTNWQSNERMNEQKNEQTNEWMNVITFIF